MLVPEPVTKFAASWTEYIETERISVVFTVPFTLIEMLVVVAIIALMILPMPEWARPLRPQWVTLVLLYWAIALPHRVGVGSGFATGTWSCSRNGNHIGARGYLVLRLAR